MSLLFQEKQNDILQEINELSKELYSSREELSEVSLKLDNCTAEIETENDRLHSLRMEFFITEKTLKDTRNQIHFINKKQLEIANNIFLLQEEFNNKESEYLSLENDKHYLLEFWDKLNSIKESLAEWNRLHKNFLELIKERYCLLKDLAERMVVVEDLNEQIILSENKCSTFEEILSLQLKINIINSDIEQLENDVEKSTSDINESKRLLSDNKNEFNTLTISNKDRKGSILFLEKEVRRYDDLISKLTDVKEKHYDSAASIDQAMKDLRVIFSDTNSLENGLRGIQDKIRDFLQAILEAAR